MRFASGPHASVSVVIPAYNQPQMLGETLRSVHAQTAPPQEVIVIDDCSPTPLKDATPCPPGLRVRWVRHAENRGPGASVAHGIREAHGERVALLNHDDIWEPQLLERLAAALDGQPDACLAFCDHGIMHADGQRDEQLSDRHSRRYARASLSAGPLAGASLYRLALLRKAVAVCSFTLVRRDALDLELIAAGSDMWDYFLAVGACRTGRPAAYVAERLGWYRVSPTMLSATHANPRKRIALARPQTAVSLVVLRSPQLRPVHRAMRRQLLGASGRALAVAARTGDPRNLVRVGAAVTAGRADARALIDGHRDHVLPAS